MRGNTALRTCALGLVVVNLVFVQLTDATSLGWLVPLYILTLLSPVMAGLRENIVYRGMWNAGVIGVFALLVRHASGYDLRYVLEDGLVLAALCQVHLLNNLRSEQRPDLLFLNSFLIAIVTAYLCEDIAYAVAFLAYVPLFVVGLQLHCVTRNGSELAPRSTLHVVRDGLRRSVALLAVTALAFLFWPRDFHRKGIIASEFEFVTSSQDLEIAFSDTVNLNRRGKAKASSLTVMTVTIEDGSRLDVPALWRGATLGTTNGAEWWPLPDNPRTQAADRGAYRWIRNGESFERTGTSGEQRTLVSVVNTDPGADRLFAPLSAARLTLGEGTESHKVSSSPDGTIRYGEPEVVRDDVQYSLVLAVQDHDLGGPVPPRAPDGFQRYTDIPSSNNLRAASDFADKVPLANPEDVEQHVLVTAYANYLSRNCSYLLPGEEGAATNLEEFLRRGAGGHCEFFASALATMLRSRFIPCRLVTGYRSAEWDASERQLTFRRRDAHSWVEVWDPQAGWYAVDPTPAASFDSGPGLWENFKTEARALWAQVASFDSEHRAAVLAWLRDSPIRAWRWALRNPVSAALVIVALVLSLALLRVQRRRRSNPIVRSYRDALRRAGLVLAPGETPRELLARARGAGLEVERLSAVRRATRDHERSRYAA